MVTQRGANGEDLTWKVRCRAKFGKAMAEGAGGGEDPKPEPRREQKGGEKKNGYGVGAACTYSRSIMSSRNS